MPKRYQPHEVIVGGWLNDLAILVANTMSPEEMRSRVSVLTSVIADAFPDSETFTKESLLYCVKVFGKYMPGFTELHEHLGAWWASKQPKTFIAPDELNYAACPAHEKTNVLVWLRHDSENDLTPREMTMRLAVIRQCCPAGYCWLVAFSPHAADIAARNEWRLPGYRAPPRTDADQEAAAHAAAQREGITTDAAGEQITTLDAVAPDPTHVVDRTMVRAMTDRIESRKGRKLGALDPAVLDAVRAQNGKLAAALQVEAAARAERESDGFATAAAAHAAEARSARVIDLFPTSDEGA